MPYPRPCTSCKKGDGIPDWAIYRVLKAPQEARETHGTQLCQSHAEIILNDFPESELKHVQEWEDATKNHKEP